MDIRITINQGRLLGEIRLEFTSTKSDGTHLFRFLKPEGMVNKRVQWEPGEPYHELLVKVITEVAAWVDTHPNGRLFYPTPRKVS